jgi:hypothetical protein
MTVVVIGDGNGGGMIAMGDSGCVAMDDGMAAQSLCAVLQSQWTAAAAMGNGGETVAIDNSGRDSTIDVGMVAQLQ